MNSEQIRTTVLSILAQVNPDAGRLVVDPEVSFHDQFAIDSVDFLRLMMGVEKAVGVNIYDFDYPRLSTLRGCEEYLLDRVGA